MSEFLYILFALMPFMVCLVWLAVYTADLRSAPRPRKFLTIFALVSTVLYFCHSWFFIAEEWEFGWPDSLYIFCNLAVYPLFYMYVAILTRDEPFRGRVIMMLLPAIALSLAAYITKGAEAVLVVSRAVFGIEVLLVAWFGMKNLIRFDREVENYYSDTEGKTLQGIKLLLIIFVVMAVASNVANFIGRDVFLHSPLLGLPSVLFSAMMFGIFYESSRINYYVRDFRKEMQEDELEFEVADETPDMAALEGRISAVMDEKKLYLIAGLKISDVAAAVGSNRTYVSNAINTSAGVPFADYVNKRRIEYAKTLLLEEADGQQPAITRVATESGFASFPSFYRAFVKYVGESPSAWLKGAKG